MGKQERKAEQKKGGEVEGGWILGRGEENYNKRMMLGCMKQPAKLIETNADVSAAGEETRG